ncbi:MAG: 50S ribosomal protein L18 [Wenzhouxiangellaceae bacterium]|nr:50S ribosomal protein L18 [Wenzhouxiangellaceae bacterium]
MSVKNISRLRRSRKTRARIARGDKARLSVFRSGRHIYAQVFTATGDRTIATASTVQPALRGELKSTSDCAAASAVGKSIAEKAIAEGINEVAFDRSGFKYHGRVKSLADAAREAGLKF